MLGAIPQNLLITATIRSAASDNPALTLSCGTAVREPDAVP